MSINYKPAIVFGLIVGAALLIKLHTEAWFKSNIDDVDKYSTLYMVCKDGSNIYQYNGPKYERHFLTNTAKFTRVTLSKETTPEKLCEQREAAMSEINTWQ